MLDALPAGYSNWNLNHRRSLVMCRPDTDLGAITSLIRTKTLEEKLVFVRHPGLTEAKMRLMQYGVVDGAGRAQGGRLPDAAGGLSTCARSPPVLHPHGGPWVRDIG